MYLPTIPLDNVGSDSANEAVFMFLEEVPRGHPLPPNVIAGVNPHNYAPSNLPDGIWFLISSKANEPAEHGFWKAKGEACRVYSNSMITGWRARLEYFEGKVPNEHKTDWVMQEYWITRNGPDKIEETSLLCRVFIGGEPSIDHHMEKNMLESRNASSSSSTNKSTVEKDDKTENLAVTGEPANDIAEIPADTDYFSRGDYLELLDFDDPASPSSSSDNSSCVTMSSDECFDSLALLKELDSEIDQNDPNCKLNITESFKPLEVVVAPASPGSFIGIKTPTEDMNTAEETQMKASTSENYGREAEKGKKKKQKNKYMCFMPFYFLF